jgi:uncharacterized membrane protein YcaP (DUF421 family)
MFAVAVICLRLGEWRTLARLGAFDFAIAVAIGAIISRTVTAPSSSVAAGAVALVTLLVVPRLVAFARGTAGSPASLTIRPGSWSPGARYKLVNLAGPA